jgi:HSP20 family protein
MNTVQETKQNSDRAVRKDRQSYVAPEVNILENKDGYVLEAEMPGVNKERLEIIVEGNELTLVGHRNAEAELGQALFRESHALDYRRVFELDPAIDTTKVSARIEQGILTLTLPKSEQVKPRKIKVD